jgi:hypothetical protein
LLKFASPMPRTLTVSFTKPGALCSTFAVSVMGG